MYKIQGITLVSIIIGVAISTFIMSSLMRIYASSRANYALSESLLELDEVMEVAVRNMQSIISQAGFRYADGSGSYPPLSSLGEYDPDIGSGAQFFDNTSAVRHVNEYGGTTVNANKNIGVKFFGANSGNIRECRGPYGDETQSTRVFFFVHEYPDPATNSTLRGYYCISQDYDPSIAGTSNTADVVNATWGDAPTTDMFALIPPQYYDHLEIRFGYDSDSGAAGYADLIAEGEDIPSGANSDDNFNQVYYVRVAILIHSREDIKSVPSDYTFNFFSTSITRTASRRLFKSKIFTIPLAYGREL